MRKPPHWAIKAAIVLCVIGGQAKAEDLYVSPTGNDTWTGRRREPSGGDGPFATIGRVQQAVRALHRRGLDEAVTVHVLPGQYVLPEGLTFGPDDGGTTDHAVHYRAETPGTVQIIGGVRIEGWTVHKGAILRAPIPAAARDARQLFQGDRRLTLAREPDEGYFHIQDHAPDRPTTAFVFRENDLGMLSANDLRDARVLIWPGEDWFTQDKGVSSFDGEARIVGLDSGEGYDMDEGNRYYLYNALPLLDVPGEAVLATSERVAYVWPVAGTAEHPIVASTARPLLSISGDQSRPVRNLHFEGLDLTVSDDDVVRFERAEDCSLRGCLVENGRASGVRINGQALRIVVVGNLVRSNGHHGVSLTGLTHGQPDVNHSHVLENNHIHHNGRLVGHGYGVEINQSGRNRVVHNHIHHHPRYGVSIKSGGFELLRQAVPDATRENRGQHIWSRANLIAFNDIHAVNTDSQDTGAVEAWQPGIDNVIDHNLIHDVGNDQFGLQSGIYLDDGADRFTVTNNVIWNVRGAGNDQPIFSKGVGNRIENNVLVVAPDNACAIVSGEMFNEACRAHSYLRNVVAFEPIPPDVVARRRGRWGQSAYDLHKPGTTLRWTVTAPADGDYDIYVRYAAENTGGASPMDGRTTLRVDDAVPVTLRNLPNTGGWDVLAWSSGAVATVALRAGANELTWTNVEGGGVNIDALVLAPAGTYAPSDDGSVDAALSERADLVVVQAENHAGLVDEARRRVAWKFINWSDDRIAASDANTFVLTGDGESLHMKNAPEETWDGWRTWGEGRFDRESVLLTESPFDPFASEPWTLRPDAAPRRLGFEPIDTSRIGLRDDFPARLDRQ